MQVEICRGIKSVIYKRKNKFSRSYFSLAVESAPVDGVRSVFYDVFFIEGTVCVLVDGAGFHLFEGQCSVPGAFGVSMHSFRLWAVFLAWVVLDMSISAATSK